MDEQLEDAGPLRGPLEEAERVASQRAGWAGLDDGAACGGHGKEVFVGLVWRERRHAELRRGLPHREREAGREDAPLAEVRHLQAAERAVADAHASRLEFDLHAEALPADREGNCRSEDSDEDSPDADELEPAEGDPCGEE
ncbi:hypothetical protein ACFPRL_08820 [Pseudoclavibacter helvolus]